MKVRVTVNESSRILDRVQSGSSSITNVVKPDFFAQTEVCSFFLVPVLSVVIISL